MSLSYEDFNPKKTDIEHLIDAVADFETRKWPSGSFAEALGLQQQAEEILKEVEELESNQQTQERTN